MRKNVIGCGLAGIALLAMIGLAAKLNIERNKIYQEQTGVVNQIQENQIGKEYSLYLASILAVGVTGGYIASEILKDMRRRNLRN